MVLVLSAISSRNFCLSIVLNFQNSELANMFVSTKSTNFATFLGSFNEGGIAG
jgi:hypothetical protein